MTDKASSFVPELIKHVLLCHNGNIDAPYELQFYSVGLFVDVSGFTKMTEKLNCKGSLGSEEVADKINSYLGQIVKKIIASGGDIVKFAGDALLCTWIPSNIKEYIETQRELKKEKEKRKDRKKKQF